MGIVLRMLTIILLWVGYYGNDAVFDNYGSGDYEETDGDGGDKGDYLATYICKLCCTYNPETPVLDTSSIFITA